MPIYQRDVFVGGLYKVDGKICRQVMDSDYDGDKDTGIQEHYEGVPITDNIMRIANEQSPITIPVRWSGFGYVFVIKLNGTDTLVDIKWVHELQRLWIIFVKEALKITPEDCI